MDYRYETHMHTSETSKCGANTAAEQVRAYKKRGYTGIITTDHFINGYSTCPAHLPWEKKMKCVVSGYEAAKQEGNKCGMDVFLGWEFTVRGSDFLTYGLDFEFLCAHPGLDKLSVEEYSALVRRSGGFIAQAHPYRDLSYIENTFPVAPELLDAVEAYNASDPAINNKKTRDFAHKHNLPMQAGSDSHSTFLSFPSGIILKERAKNIFDIINAIKARDITLILP